MFNDIVFLVLFLQSFDFLITLPSLETAVVTAASIFVTAYVGFLLYLIRLNLTTQHKHHLFFDKNGKAWSFFYKLKYHLFFKSTYTATAARAFCGFLILVLFFKWGFFDAVASYFDLNSKVAYCLEKSEGSVKGVVKDGCKQACTPYKYRPNFYPNPTNDYDGHGNYARNVVACWDQCRHTMQPTNTIHPWWKIWAENKIYTEAEITDIMNREVNTAKEFLDTSYDKTIRFQNNKLKSYKDDWSHRIGEVPRGLMIITLVLLSPFILMVLVFVILPSIWGLIRDVVLRIFKRRS